MKQKILKIFFFIVKNLLAFLAGSVLGVLTVIIFAEPLIARAINKDIGLGIIAVAPILLAFHFIIFGTIGGIIAVILYNVARFTIRRRRIRQN